MSLPASALDQLFRNARTHNAWQAKPVSDSLLITLHDLMKWGPTSANCWPLRVVYVKSPEARARLLPLMMEGNRAKTEAAPVTAILGMDLGFPDTLPVVPAQSAPGIRGRFAHPVKSRRWRDGA